MLLNVLIRVSRFIVFRVEVFACLSLAALTVGVSGAGIFTTDYSEYFCGSPLSAVRQEPVVVPPHSAAVPVPVAISGFAFAPQDLTINVGDTVTWTNNDGAFHTSTSDTGVWSSGDLMNGQTFSFTFTSAGVFPYHCGRHLFMTASVTVVAPSPTPTPAVSGTVTYGNAISGPPPPRFVSNVVLSGVGSPNVSTTTSFPSGTYTLTGFGASSYTVTPTKTDGVNGISSFDAAKIAQHVAGSVALTGNQLIVADVSNNGAISSFDAAQIAKYVAASPPFGMTAAWKFIPVNKNYASVTNNVTGEDFVALLMGEVSGNWANTGSTPTPTPTP